MLVQLGSREVPEGQTSGRADGRRAVGREEGAFRLRVVEPWATFERQRQMTGAAPHSREEEKIAAASFPHLETIHVRSVSLGQKHVHETAPVQPSALNKSSIRVPTKRKYRNFGVYSVIGQGPRSLPKPSGGDPSMRCGAPLPQ